MRNAQACLFTLLSVSIYILFIPKLSNAVDTITPSLSISDGETNETIVSAAEQFELGFFSPRDSNNRYLGIWFKKVQPQTVVWVANRDNPITNSTGVLKISDNGNLELVDQTSSVVWSSNVTGVSNSIVQLLDTGNLVIREGGNTDTRDFLWQSFDHPTDTLLPHMKLGWDLRSGLDRMLTSWKAPNDPAAGDYSVKVVLGRFPQSFAYSKQVPTSRFGSWNGLTFTGVPQINQSFIFSFDFTLNQYESYYSFSLKNDSIYSRLVLSSSGQLQRMTWLEKDQSWDVYWYYPKDPCDSYKKCGDNGICSFKDSQTCTCLEGYQPKNPQDWFLRDGSGGCIQKTKYECQKNDGFLHLKQMKLPDTSNSNSFIDSSLSLKKCEAECIRNCSCKAYANSNITNGGSGCIIWVDDLVDLRDFNIGGQDLYVRVADSLLGNGGNKDSTNDSKKKKPVTLIVIATVIPAIFLVVLGLCFALRKKKTITMPIKAVGKGVSHEESQELPLFDMVKAGSREYSNESKDELELPVFGLYTVETATYNFSNANKLGEGGFGSVYKGTLEDGQQIAVKRLSKNSTQGVKEFKNEVVLIARLQHRNLVRLLGCCVEGDEKILIYEYLQNKSLDSIIFDKSSSLSLDWQQRFNIVLGIARGLLYLHQDSRFRIIHRDLKASNVLLDAGMNPKISDFGMARIFGGDQTEANTMRVVGTYGYMSPEYAMDGLFSIKSDVFSFGVLVLEIVSGIKNRGYYSSSDQSNLLGNAWKQWREGNALEQIIDPSVEDDSTPSEVLRCIQVGLLCVQERAEDRPNMASVLLMLSSEFPSMPQPKQPGFWFATGLLETEASSSNPKSSDSNQVTVTMLQARE